MDTIREWLGHVSVDTTTIYAQSSLQMKKEAIDKCLPSNLNKRKSKKSYKDDEELLNFLESL
jgi:integrase